VNCPTCGAAAGPDSRFCASCGKPLPGEHEPRLDAGAPQAEDVVAPPPLHPRYPLTVGLRGTAAIAIIVGHAWFFTGGFGGGFFPDTLPNKVIVRWDGVVAVFFMLSAFLLYRPMIAHRSAGPAAPRTSAYAWRRFLRLYPAYWLALTALALWPGLYGVFGHHWWAFYSLTDFLDPNTLHAGCPPADEFRCGLPQSWTLGIDMTFYVLLPLYAALAALLVRGRDRRGWMGIEFALLALLAAGSLILGGPPLDLRGENWFRYSALGHLYWFALGMALAVISVAYTRKTLPRAIRAAADRPGLCWAAGLGIYAITVLTFSVAPFVFQFQASEYVALNLLQGVAALCFFLPAVFGDPNRGLPARVLGHPFLMWAGVISYGLLLWHGTVAAALGTMGGEGYGYWTVLIGQIVFAVPLAIAAYYLVERPLMKLKYRPLRELLAERRRRKAAPVPEPGGPA
jgi:peptidoglycan/LPS O-acetylase OafA/YrhL